MSENKKTILFVGADPLTEKYVTYALEINLDARGVALITMSGKHETLEGFDEELSVLMSAHDNEERLDENIEFVPMTMDTASTMAQALRHALAILEGSD